LPQKAPADKMSKVKLAIVFFGKRFGVFFSGTAFEVRKK
jgi:hypothetical protein